MNEFTVKRRGYEVSTMILNGRGQTVAEVFTNREPGDQYETAALFAAAPELLAALRNLLADAEALDIDSSNVSGSAIEARAAIAKAIA